MLSVSFLPGHIHIHTLKITPSQLLRAHQISIILSRKNSPCYPTSQTNISIYPIQIEEEERTISPHTTLCLYSPRNAFPVRYPSLPAINPLQSRASCRKTSPASAICAGFNPNIRHLPIRVLTCVNHRGSIVCGFAGAAAREIRDVENSRPLLFSTIPVTCWCCMRRSCLVRKVIPIEASGL